eukprot:g2872.t1
MGIGNLFKSSTELSARCDGHGCQVEVVITCEATGPWGMINLIESFMEEEAKLGVESYLTFCETRLADLKSELNNDSSIEDHSTTSEDKFFDIHYETLSQVSSPISETPVDDEINTEAMIALRLKRLEENGQMASIGVEKILERMEEMERSFAKTQRTSYIAIIGLSALSFALGASLIAMKYRHD